MTPAPGNDMPAYVDPDRSDPFDAVQDAAYGDDTAEVEDLDDDIPFSDDPEDEDDADDEGEPMPEDFDPFAEG